MFEKKKKYIITDYGIVLSEEPATHSEMLMSFSVKPKVLSAGFFWTEIKNNDLFVSAYGKSISLNVDSKPDDARKIKEFLLR